MTSCAKWRQQPATHKCIVHIMHGAHMVYGACGSAPTRVTGIAQVAGVVFRSTGAAAAARRRAPA
eukprot:scaffold1445_cov100-Isochrysis_galbana.AAC.3